MIQKRDWEKVLQQQRNSFTEGIGGMVQITSCNPLRLYGIALFLRVKRKFCQISFPPVVSNRLCIILKYLYVIVIINKNRFFCDHNYFVPLIEPFVLLTLEYNVLSLREALKRRNKNKTKNLLSCIIESF